MPAHRPLCVAKLAVLLLLTPFAVAAGPTTAPITAPTTAPAWQPVPGQLMTRWAKDVDPAAPLPEYPRPQMVRKAWQNLNGLWDYAVVDKGATATPAAHDGKLLVPFPIQSALSGVKRQVSPEQRLFYHRTFTVPPAWNNQAVLLHFGAVDYESVVSVNGREVGRHVGGYDPFTFDVTSALKLGENDLAVNVYDATGVDQPTGKQRIKTSGIFYTNCTGIWQTVWLEPVPTLHVSALKIVPDVDGSTLRLTVTASGGGGGGATVSVTAGADGKPVATGTGQTGSEIAVPIAAAHLWTPDDPYLYSLHVAIRQGDRVLDAVDSYFAMRKVSLGKDAKGRTRILLNNQFVFQRGVLDQGYWPDGIYTAPTDAALRSDVDLAKRLGFNLNRKHVKVEPDRWYYWCDQRGLLVWQDMPSAFSRPGSAMPAPARAQFITELTRLVETHANHPSIVVWTTFNEGWGEHDVKPLVDLVRRLDPTRLVNDASGWVDVAGAGDLRDTHHYPEPACTDPEPTRAVVCGEFGGLGMRVPGHSWTDASWGYQGLASGSWSLTRQFQKLIRQAYGLRDERAMSAYVYTQLTDVENESNGMVTYDRAVMKPDGAIAAAANAGQFVPLPPNPHPELVPTSADEAQTWRYTTDKPADDWVKPAFDAKGWKQGPGAFGHGVGHPGTPWTTGDIWLRRTVTLPEKLPAKIDVLTFHDEDVEVYANGIAAASAGGHVPDYVRLPMSADARTALTLGENVIAVHCHQTVGLQYIDVGLIAGGK